MLRVSPLEHALVHGEGVGDVTLANDATTRSAQGEVDPASLLRLRIADLPRLCICVRIKSKKVLHYEQKLRRTPQSAALDSQLFLPSSRGVASVVKGSLADAVASVARGSLGAAVDSVARCSFAVASVARCSFAVAAVAWDSATATATKCLSLRACKRRIRLEAGHAKFCPGGSGILPATGPAAFLLRFLRHGGARQAQYRH